MSQTASTIGAFIAAYRAERQLSLQDLAGGTELNTQRLSQIEAGDPSTNVTDLTAIAAFFKMPFSTLIGMAHTVPGGSQPPVTNANFFRQGVPLPDGLTANYLKTAVDLTQKVIHQMNRNMITNVGSPLQKLIQGNNFSGLVSNVLSNSMDQCTPYKHNHHQKYPDLLNPNANGGAGDGLEIKVTIQHTKGGESHNGHSGWHMIACYTFLPDGDVQFVNLMFANLVAHGLQGEDWTYVGSNKNAKTGSQRTETYNTTGQGTTKLRDGSAYLDPNYIDFSKWRQNRIGSVPAWSIFAPPPATSI